MISLRDATLDDVPAIVAMMIDFNRHEGIDWSPERGEPALRTLIVRRDLGYVGLIVDDGATAGYCVVTWGFDLEWDGRDAFLTELYVAPQARGRGVGRAALEALERIAREHEVRALHLAVRHDNGSAKRLYERVGFEELPRALMSKDLRGK